MNENNKSFYFSGCSWGCIYHIGVYKKICEIFSREELDNMKWGGTSSGGLVALCIALSKTPDECLQLFNEFSDKAKKNGVFGKMSIYHRKILSMLCPDGGDEYKSLNGRLFIGITRFLCKFELISEWKSNKDLRDTLHASMHIPFYMTHIEKVKGKFAMDGGFSGNIANIDENTITISPTMNLADIRPKKLLTSIECYRPSSNYRINELKSIGENNTKFFFSNIWKKKLRNKENLRKKIMRYFLVSSFWGLRLLEEFGFKKFMFFLILLFLSYKKRNYFFLYLQQRNNFLKNLLIQ